MADLTNQYSIDDLFADNTPASEEEKQRAQRITRECNEAFNEEQRQMMGYLARSYKASSDVFLTF